MASTRLRRRHDTVGIGVIGYGYWGPNLVRNFADVAGATVVSVSDLRSDRLDFVRRRHPTVETTTDHRDIVHDPRIDVVVVAAPPSTHFELARQALEANKHVLVEKPFTSTSDEAERLIELAARRRRVLMVDHTFVYSGAVQKIKDLVDGGELGRPYYWDSVRVNLGIFQRDVSVLADLAAHDLSIIDYILDARPVAVAATGIANVAGQSINTAYLTCFFDQDLLAHFHVNWLAPVKVRRTLIGGERRMIVYDDLEPSDKIKVYDSGIDLPVGDNGRFDMLVSYRAGDMWAPRLSPSEALAVEASHLIECVKSGHQPITDGHAGHRVVRILEAATRSLADRGRPIELNWEKSNAAHSVAGPEGPVREPQATH
jgi:predicted dehydrogenase